MLVFKNPKIIWPNLLTSLNLLSGCIAVLSFLNQQYILGIVLVLIGAFCDFLDGLVARALKVTGDFGKELDPQIIFNYERAHSYQKIYK
mgnify:CR=1 FL=1